MKMHMILTAVFVMVTGFGAFAEEAAPGKKEAPVQKEAMSKEMKEKMATAHEAMAKCLRSDKTIKECRHEMRESCEKSMGEDGCPMMGGMKGRKGMMMHKNMDH